MMQVARQQPFGPLTQFLPLMAPEKVARGEALPSLEPPTYRVAILEGNASLARLLATGFAADRAAVQIHGDLNAAMQQMEVQASDLLILDLDLEGVDGLASLATLRATQATMRILVLSTQAGVDRAVEALNQGADDYLMKPFSLLEMMARVRALRRRSKEGMQTPRPTAGRLVLHRDQGRVACDGRSIDLTPRECELLEFMMAHPGETLSRATLSQHVWDMPAEANTNIVDVYVKYLRDKLESTCEGKPIRTVRGVGYIFQA